MPEDPRPPVAIRITRPQTTEEEFLEQELDTISRTGVTLLGAQPRPQGVVLRFELVLSSGHVLMRGEGRVVGFRPNAHQGLGGLSLRFTRLDSRTKSLVDKATTIRERRRPSSSPGHPRVGEGSPPPPAAELPLALGALAADHPEPSAPPPSVAPPPVSAQPISVTPVSAPPPPVAAPRARSVPPPLPPAARRQGASSPPARPVQPPAARDALLARLRERASTLDGAAVQRILAQRKRG